MFKQALQQVAADYPLDLSAQQLEKFARYNDLLLEWNEKINLTAITEPEQVAVKHMADSLSCYRSEIFPAAAAVIDVGTGAGFPGIPLKIFREDLQLTLLDSLNKRIKFLDCIASSLQLSSVELLHGRAEDVARKKGYREQFDIAVSRAVARLRVLSELCLPFVKVGGYFIALKGAQYQEEIAEATAAIALLGGKVEAVVPIHLPKIADKRAVIYIKKIGKTTQIYPRKAGIPEKNPL